MNHHIIMGRKTYESLGRSLPGRTNVVVTRRKGFKAPDCLVAFSMEEALRLCRQDEEVFVIGGANVFEQALPFADRIYMTLVGQDFEGDTFFQKLDEATWKETSRENFPKSAENPFPYSFIVYEKRDDG